MGDGQLRQRLADLSTTATAIRTVSPAGAQHIQFQEEIRHLSERNAWKGVETAFQGILSLQTQGERPTAEDWMAGAQAARGLGRAMDVRLRLVQAYALAPSSDTVKWLNDIEANYGAVSLRNERKEPVVLESTSAPFAPDLRAAIDAANQTLTDTRRFEGLLPRGAYQFGGETLLVTPGGTLTACSLTGEGCRSVK